jgi:hypothetical protein
MLSPVRFRSLIVSVPENSFTYVRDEHPYRLTIKLSDQDQKNYQMKEAKVSHFIQNLPGLLPSRRLNIVEKGDNDVRIVKWAIDFFEDFKMRSKGDDKYRQAFLAFKQCVTTKEIEDVTYDRKKDSFTAIWSDRDI